MMLSSKIALAQCNEQYKYIYTWNITDEKAELEIHLKNYKPFSYYEFGNYNSGFIFTEVPYKINTEVIIKLSSNDYDPYDSYGSFMYKGVTEKKVQNIFYPYNSISIANKGVMHSIIFKFPLLEKDKKTKISYSKLINYSDMIKNYKNLLEYNNLYGKHKVKFYVTLLESPDLEHCALFESPIVEINLGRKPFKKVWNDLFQ